MLQSVLDEYTELLRLRLVYSNRLSELPKGYISKKTIGNKEYHYLQFRNKGKVESKYLKDDEVGEMRKLLALRKEAESAAPEIDRRLCEIEKATRMLDASLFRRLGMLRISIGMDDIGREEKENCVSFSDAMTAIEGVTVSNNVQHELNCWMNGDISFLSVFERTLRHYGFPVEG